MSRFSPYWLWALLTTPAAFWTYQALTSDNARIFHRLVHPTGELSARILIITMMITPLVLLFRSAAFPRWLKKNRRYFGVAAFGYAALHTIFYLVDKGSTATVLSELSRFYIWTGWLAFVVFIPLALTSMNYFQRIMGRWWKWLQRWTYAAAVLTLLHWAALHNWRSPAAAIVHFTPLALLEAYRIWYWYLRPRKPTAA
ncbi:ferric reductase-like transmembrane domain-containing protein [Vannielia sp.]|uniref:sulfite oxidase heme-binding subunit YedZ n=1 Tax=Vannielia sp. TaxID=2813045 RepID=UPI00260BFB5B|nr:ferric reductase-like transmembrane domain-containing protein [Vannielia sp.]MDF1873789.1 ferric reductase-like transmembrane domain-containing protein [Vannielia sp.]